MSGYASIHTGSSCLLRSRPYPCAYVLYKTLSAAVYGIDASVIEVEVDVSGIKMQEDHFHTVGLPDAAVRESRERVRAALKNCGYDIPPTQITINLAPADIRKEGLRLRSPHGARHFRRIRRP